MHSFSTGGVWINLGPLLYHYSDIPGENSIEPTYEMVREIVQGLGFVIEVCSVCCFTLCNSTSYIHWLPLNLQKERTGVKTTYSQNVRSMLKYEYESVFFVCRKPWKKNLWYYVLATTECPIVAVYFLNNNKNHLKFLNQLIGRKFQFPPFGYAINHAAVTWLFPDVCHRCFFECQRKFFV